jgi:hypothetical protein
MIEAILGGGTGKVKPGKKGNSNFSLIQSIDELVQATYKPCEPRAAVVAVRGGESRALRNSWDSQMG